LADFGEILRDDLEMSFW